MRAARQGVAVTAEYQNLVKGRSRSRTSSGAYITYFRQKATNPNDPFWSPEQEIDFNAKPEYAERNYQETNDPYDHDWGFDRSENVSDSHLIHQKKNRLHMRIRKVPFQTNLRKIQDRLLRYSTEEKKET